MRIATTPSNTLRIAASAIKDESEPVAGIVPRDLDEAELTLSAVLWPLVGAVLMFGLGVTSMFKYGLGNISGSVMCD
ncbi:hypothetical protein QP420_03125 [Bifidobacterium sp. UMB1197]|nr:hypothetical protein [Bifidobacterium sp. UMB1197]